MYLDLPGLSLGQQAEWVGAKEALDSLKAAYKKADDKYLPIWKKKFKEIRYDKETLDQFKSKAGKPIQDEWVAANKDQFDAQAVLDVILNYK